MKNILINLSHQPAMSWRPVSWHKVTLRMGNYPETFRPALNRNDLNQINDQVFKYPTAPHTFVNSIKSLKCWSTNADSLINKMNELKARIYLFKPDIIVVTEIYPKQFV